MNGPLDGSMSGSMNGQWSDVEEQVWDDGSFDATARIVDAVGDTDERQVEAALRPKRLEDFPGQTRVREQLGLVLKAAKRRGTPPDHVLLSGPPGLGKTTLAMIVASELERPIRITSGPAIQHAGDLASVLSSLAGGRGALPRRDPPHVALGRGDALPRHGGLPRRRHHRQGPGGDGDPARAAAVHGRRCHDPRRAAAGPAARPLRLHWPPRLLRGGRPRDDPAPLGASARARRRRRRHRARSPSARAAPPASPTGCCAGYATGPRCTARTASLTPQHGRRSRSSTSTSAASTASTAPSSKRCCRRFNGGPGRALDPRRRGGGGARHRRDGRRALPRAGGLHGAHPARPGRLDASPGSTSDSPRPSTPRPCGRRRCRSTRPAAGGSTPEATRP